MNPMLETLRNYVVGLTPEQTADFYVALTGALAAQVNHEQLTRAAEIARNIVTNKRDLIAG